MNFFLFFVLFLFQLFVCPIYSQEYKKEHIVHFYPSGYTVSKMDSIYFAVTYDEKRSSDDANFQLVKNIELLDKIKRKIQKDISIDILELVNVTNASYVCYYYVDRYKLEYEFDQEKSQFDGRILRIELPYEIFTYGNIEKICNYMSEHIDKSMNKPYYLELREDEILKILREK